MAVPGGPGAAWNTPSRAPSRRRFSDPRRLTPLVGRYEIVRLLGEGRRQRIYLAFDKRLDREVALGLIKSQELGESELLAIWREAEAMARVSGHPNTVTIYDCGDDAQERMYLVSEYFADGDLATLIAGAALPVPRITQIATDVAHALVHAHALGIFHGDIEPGNVWFSCQGVAKLGGFGCSGATAERSDVRALGAMIHDLLRGQPAGEVLAALSEVQLDTELLRESLVDGAATSCTG